MREWRYLLNGSTLRLDTALCIGCGACVEVCPHEVFHLAEGKALLRDRSLCMECGACARNCPVGALDVEAGVGCAAAIIIGKLRGTAPDCSGACGCEDGRGGACC